MKKIMALLITMAMALSLAGCGDDELMPTEGNISEVDQWAIYWYLCGSDLESDYALATDDLLEMMEVDLPENVKVIIQTGGADQWHNDLVDPDKMQRYVYDSDGMTLIEEGPVENMGDPETLRDFLAFARENYPADRTMVNFWNHGGGSVSGAAFDEQHTDEDGNLDSLNLAEMYQAFTAVYEEDPDNQPIDIIGFDTCLMATIDTAYTFSDLGKYLVASEELAPGGGWLYSGWLEALADDPAMDPLALSKVICDTYLEGCQWDGEDENVTLSVTDLSKVDQLILAYDAFGKEALQAAIENPGFFGHFSKIANSIENYGGNTREQGFTNMADLGHLAKKSAKMLPETSGHVIAALEDCVVYKVSGKYRPESMGLACYYSYNGDMDDFMAYTDIGAGEAFKYFYYYGLTGELLEDGMDYIAQMAYEALPDLQTLSSMAWEDVPVTVDEEGVATIDLGSQADDILSSVTFELYYVDEEEDIMLCLGTTDDVIADWDAGVFKDNFRGVWGSIDGEICYMEIAHMGDDYSQYSLPILLNGEAYNLMVIYDFNKERFSIQGARKPLGDSGAADKNLRKLQVGDEIQTIHYGSLLSEDADDLIEIPMDTIIVSPETAFDEIELGDGVFIMMYMMEDYQGNVAYSAPITFEIEDGEIYISGV